MAKLKNINFMSGTQFTNLETTKEDELYAVNIENDKTFKSFVSGMGMPSEKYTNLTLGASGSSYIAPANGWFVLSKRATAVGQYIQLYKSLYSSLYSATTDTSSLITRLPVTKGANITVYYSAGGETNYFKFIYAEGEK